MEPTSPDPSDEELAATIAQHGHSPAARRVADRAFSTLYDRYKQGLFRFLAARTPKADVEDAVQETWQRVWKCSPTQFHGGRFSAWLFTIADHVAIDWVRKKKPLPWKGEDVAAPRDDQSAVHADRQERLQRCMKHLAPDEASVFRARLEGRPYEEIAEVLGITMDRAYKLFHQAKEQLKPCVQRAES